MRVVRVHMQGQKHDPTAAFAGSYGARDGDSIEVHSGTYVENVDVYKRLTLIGAGASVVTVRAANSNDALNNDYGIYLLLSSNNTSLCP